MLNVQAGETVALAAEFQTGAFPDEYMVTFSSLDGPVSGFVKQGNAVTTIGTKLFLKALVQEVSESELTLFVRGSFFTNSGYVKVKPDQLSKAHA